MAARLATDRFGGLGLDGSLAVSSCGVAVSFDHPPCEQALALAKVGGRRGSAVVPHQPEQFNAVLITAADLVLTADRDQRAAVIHLAPSAKSYTFTLREAATLASAVRQRLSHGDPQEGERRRGDVAQVDLAGLHRSTGPPARLRWLALEMNAARGLVPLPEPRPSVRRLWPRATASLAPSPYDIPDPHRRGGASHWSTVEIVQVAIDELAGCIEELLRFDPGR